MLEGWIGPLYRFQVSVTGPRPESYREDVAHAAHYNNFGTIPDIPCFLKMTYGTRHFFIHARLLAREKE